MSHSAERLDLVELLDSPIERGDKAIFSKVKRKLEFTTIKYID